MKNGLTSKELKAAMSIEAYQAELNWWIAPATKGSQAP